jgi:multidrug efflux system membrane fusion protein
MRIRVTPPALLFVIPLAAACTVGNQAASGEREAGASAGVGPAVPVTVAPVIKKSMPVELRVVGTAEASSTVAIRAQVSGELTTVGFAEGDDVSEGQLLFTIDRRPYEAALLQSEANLQRAVAQAANARAQAQRLQDLASRGIVSREQMDTAAATAAALEATVAADRAAVDSSRVQVENVTIRAPMAGRTGALMVHAGNLVRANDTTPLVVINRLSPINVSFAIPESQLAAVRHYLARGHLNVHATPGDEDEPVSGRITFVDNEVDETTGTIKLKGTFANADRRLWPGQFVNVVLQLTTEPDAVVVPTLAVQAGQQNQYVYVVKPDQTVEVRPVVVSRATGGESIIKEGLTPGETVVTDGQLRLVAGSRVSLKPSAAAAGAGQ